MIYYQVTDLNKVINDQTIVLYLDTVINDQTTVIDLDTVINDQTIVLYLDTVINDQTTVIDLDTVINDQNYHQLTRSLIRIQSLIAPTHCDVVKLLVAYENNGCYRNVVISMTEQVVGK